VALPMTYEEFQNDIDAAAASHDFARVFLEGFLKRYPDKSIQFAWHAGYKPSVLALSDALASATRLGIGVVAGATLTDFRRLLASYRTVTLFGHFCGWDIRPEELHDTSAFVEALRTAPDPAWCRLRSAVENSMPPLASDLSAGDPILAAAALTDLLRAQPLLNDATACGKQPDTPDAYWPWKNRQALATRLPWLADPRVYEFRDGLSRLSEVIDAIPKDFAGTIDFVVCNAIFLAEAAQRRPRCRIIASNNARHLGRQALIYDAILKTMQQHDLSYLDAVEQLHAAWIEHERQLHVQRA
jgi:hypothetical protein